MNILRNNNYFITLFDKEKISKRFIVFLNHIVKLRYDTNTKFLKIFFLKHVYLTWFLLSPKMSIVPVYWTVLVSIHLLDACVSYRNVNKQTRRKRVIAARVHIRVECSSRAMMHSERQRHTRTGIHTRHENCENLETRVTSAVRFGSVEPSCDQ